ncbi:MAG: substrate-binding domain-containing protein [Rhizobacter sp.]|nr:substrate-binding domain-containing protein [Chlorobiales bacterium]
MTHIPPFNAALHRTARYFGLIAGLITGSIAGSIGRSIGNVIAGLMATGLSIFMLTSCSGGGTKSSGETATSGSLALFTDDRLKTLTDSLAAAFTQKNPDARLTVESLNADSAIARLLRKDARMILVSRRLTADETASEEKSGRRYARTLLVRDAICLITHPDLRLDASLSELREVYSGKVKEWSQSGAMEADSLGKKVRLPVKLFVMPEAHGTRGYLRDSLLAGAPLTADVRICADAQSMIDSVSKTKGAMGYVSMADSRLDVNKMTADTLFRVARVRADTLDAPPRRPYQANVATGAYPLAYNYYLMYWTEEDLPRGFAGFAVKDGQRIIKDFGLAPMQIVARITAADIRPEKMK